MSSALASSVRAQTGEVVSLETLQAYAEVHAPALRVAREREAYAEADRAQARPRVPQNPGVEVGIGPRFNGATSHDFDFYVSLTQAVATGGVRARRLEAAERAEDRYEAETVAARFFVHQATAHAYHAAQLAKAREALAARVVELHERLVAVAARRLEAGEGSRIDLDLAEVERVRAKEAALLAREASTSARLTLCELTGWPLSSPPEIAEATFELHLPPELASLTERLRATHPALFARRAATEEASARVRVADGEGRSSPVFGVQVAREGSAGSPANYIVLGSVGVAVPVARRNQGERARARVDQSVARAEEDGEARTLEARLARAHAAYVSSAERAALFRSGARPALDESLALLRRAFEAGELGIVDLTVAEGRFVDAELASLDAYADHVEARVLLEAALGSTLEGGAR